MGDENKSECCSGGHGKGGCCGGKKAIIGVVLAILLFSAGYLVAKAGMCGKDSMKICPMGTMQK